MSWSGDIPTNWHLISIPSYIDGALIDVEFKCNKCGRKLIAEGIEIPLFGMGENKEESRRWGDNVVVECKCGDIYNLVADNTIAGWMVEFEENPPATFRYKIRKIFRDSEEDEV
jgi:hypothetical protein